MGRKLTITAVVSLLLCSVTLMEFPELINLADDTTNNFTFLTSPGEIASLAADRIKSEERKFAISRKGEHSLGLQQPAAASETSNSLLPLLCIRRT